MKIYFMSKLNARIMLPQFETSSQNNINDSTSSPLWRSSYFRPPNRRNSDQDVNRKTQGQSQSPVLPHEKGFKKGNHANLPIIDLSSGPNTSNVKDALLHYCERKLGPISRTFEEPRHYCRLPIPTCDPTTLELANDPHKINIDGHLVRLRIF